MYYMYSFSMSNVELNCTISVHIAFLREKTTVGCKGFSFVILNA